MGMTPTSRHRLVALAAVAGLTIAVATGCSDDFVTPAPEVPVIRLGAGGPGDMAASEAAGISMPASDDGNRIEGWFPWFNQVEYRLVGDLSAPATRGTVWRYLEPAVVSPDRAAVIASAFGITGAYETFGADFGGGAGIGPQDGSGPSLYFSADGPRSWWYQPAWNGGIERNIVVDEAPVAIPEPGAGDDMIDREDMITIEPVPMTPPPGVPDATTAEAEARRIWEAIGVPLDRVEIEVWADEWSASVTAWYLLEGIRTWQAWSIGFGEDAAIIWASGVDQDPEAVGEVDLVSVDQALARLREMSGTWWGGGPLVAVEDIAVAPSVIDEGPGASDMVVPETLTIELVDIESEWWTLTDVDARMWLVPAFVFLDADGGRYSVPAIPDDLVETEALPVMPMPEPLPIPEPGVEPEGPAIGMPSEGSGDLPGLPGGDLDPDFDPNVLIGQDPDTATEIAAQSGYSVRVVSADGEALAVTTDYRLDRVNISVVDGRITEVTIG
jgi:hypothetical protein